MTPTQTLVPTYSQMLKAVGAWLGKAEASGEFGDEVLAARLAPDMFPLATQVRFACVQAYEGVAWLRGDDFPPIWRTLLDEGRNGPTSPGTLDEAKGRIRDTIRFLSTVDAADLDEGADRAIALKLPDGRVFDMTGSEYIRDWAIPQFYFHVMAAYSILRHEGVDLGKADYVAHAFTYLRPDA